MVVAILIVISLLIPVEVYAQEPTSYQCWCADATASAEWVNLTGAPYVTLDRLTASAGITTSTMILSDDDTDQTLTGSLGWLDFSLAGRDPGTGTEKRLSLEDDQFLGGPFYHAAFGALAYGFVRQDPANPTTHFQHFGQVDFGGGPGPFLDIVGLVDTAGSGVGQVFAILGAGGTPAAWLSDEPAATTIFGSPQQLLLLNTATATPYFQVGRINSVAGGSGMTYSATLDSLAGSGGLLQNEGATFNAYGIPATGAGEDFVGISTGMQLTASAMDVASAISGQFVARIVGDATPANAYSGDVTELVAGSFAPFVEDNASLGTVGETIGCRVIPYLYETVPLLIGYKYSTVGVGMSAPTLEYASYFDGDSLWVDNRVIWFGTDKDIGLSSNVAGRLVLAPSVADTDIELLFNATTNDGSMRWMEDEDRFEWGTSGTVLATEDDGDTYWIGDGTGLPYGSCYGNEIAWAQAAAVQNTWYEISDADMADGQLNEVTHDGNGKLTVGIAGRYLINWSLSGTVSVNNDHIQGTISISGTEQVAGMCHYNSSLANEDFTLAGTAILDLAASATVEVSIRTTDNNTPTIGVDHLNITVVHVGGT